MQKDPFTLLNIAGQEHKQLIKTAAGTFCAQDLESSVCSRNRKKWVTALYAGDARGRREEAVGTPLC